MRPTPIRPKNTRLRSTGSFLREPHTQIQINPCIKTQAYTRKRRDNRRAREQAHSLNNHTHAQSDATHTNTQSKTSHHTQCHNAAGEQQGAESRQTRCHSWRTGRAGCPEGPRARRALPFHHTLYEKQENKGGEGWGHALEDLPDQWQRDADGHRRHVHPLNLARAVRDLKRLVLFLWGRRRRGHGRRGGGWKGRCGDDWRLVSRPVFFSQLMPAECVCMCVCPLCVCA